MKIQRANKSYRCGKCSGEIYKGDKYKKAMASGRAYEQVACRFHVECPVFVEIKNA